MAFNYTFYFIHNNSHRTYSIKLKHNQSIYALNHSYKAWLFLEIFDKFVITHVFLLFLCNISFSLAAYQILFLINFRQFDYVVPWFLFWGVFLSCFLCLVFLDLLVFSIHQIGENFLFLQIYLSFFPTPYCLKLSHAVFIL